MSWDLKCDEYGMRASLHARQDSDIRLQGFAKDTGEHGNPPFVCLEVSEGNYPARSSVSLYLTPQQAEDMLAKLTDAIVKAIGG